MDDEVRALERATGAGDLESAQRLALTLERAGRADDVIPALLRGREHPAIRREIGARWDRLYLPDSRFVDVPAIRAPSWRASRRARRAERPVMAVTVGPECSS